MKQGDYLPETLDPSQIDGEPHEVAEQVGRNLQDLLEAAREGAEGLAWAARGAWMSAEEHRTGQMPSGSDFYLSAHGRMLLELNDSIKHAQQRAATLTLAAAWNPRSHL